MSFFSFMLKMKTLYIKILPCLILTIFHECMPTNHLNAVTRLIHDRIA